ncbi:MAG: hypothetical protein R3E61_00100 [Pseudomonadales bacterium]
MNSAANHLPNKSLKGARVAAGLAAARSPFSSALGLDMNQPECSEKDNFYSNDLVYRRRLCNESRRYCRNNRSGHSLMVIAEIHSNEIQKPARVPLTKSAIYGAMVMFVFLASVLTISLQDIVRRI